MNDISRPAAAPTAPLEGAEDLDGVERPHGAGQGEAAWGSDPVAETLRRLGLPFVALVPGSSFRGLHDSLVNHLGNRDPQMVLCLHEEHAVAIADGYSRVTDQPIAVALHANVGLMHASMALYNAWCDRAPMVVLGANGPVDAHHRRPWIDWVHTARDQAAMVRPFIKWDDQPASTEAAVEAVLRAHQIATTAPFGPTYVCLDVGQQETPLAAPLPPAAVQRFAAPPPPAAPAGSVAAVAGALARARRPVLMFGRAGRGEAEWQRRIALAEATGAAVLTSMHNPSVFPTDHAQHLLPPCAERRSEAEMALLAQADLLVSFDWMDLAGYVRSCTGHAQTLEPVAATVVHCSLDALLANGWSMDHQALPAVDIPVLAHPDTFTAQLLDAVAGQPAATDWDFAGAHWTSHLPDAPVGDLADRIALGDFAMTIRRFGMAHPTTFVRLPLGWPRAASHFTHPLAYLGKDGGGAVGVGPGHAVGAALALRGSGRFPTAVLGDGDLLMGINALWTASHMRLPLLVVVANNTSFFNDEIHQETVARARNRPVENRWIGQRLADPEVDIAAMARAQGFATAGPVRRAVDLADALAEGAAAVAGGGRFLIDARIEPGYAAAFGLPPA